MLSFFSQNLLTSFFSILRKCFKRYLAIPFFITELVISYIKLSNMADNNSAITSSHPCSIPNAINTVSSGELYNIICNVTNKPSTICFFTFDKKQNLIRSCIMSHLQNVNQLFDWINRSSYTNQE